MYPTMVCSSDIVEGNVIRIPGIYSTDETSCFKNPPPHKSFYKIWYLVKIGTSHQKYLI